ncbi:MAG: hypothetical protein K6G30_03915, partial [Acetatifactor sp.]|nr:hypothetical protein [Acetatifactor sp.]
MFINFIRNIKRTVLPVAVVAIASMVGFFFVPQSVRADVISETILNGDFEAGDLTGWTLLDGTAAVGNLVGEVSDATKYWEGAMPNRYFYKQGTYFLRGEYLEQKSGGAIRSSSFRMGGDGCISFLIGAGSAENKGCVRLYCEQEGQDRLVRTYTNRQWSDPKTGLTLLRIYDCLEEYIGDTMYFVVENGTDTSNFAFINVDDFRTSMTWSEMVALKESEIVRADRIEDIYKTEILACYQDAKLYGTEANIEVSVPKEPQESHEPEQEELPAPMPSPTPILLPDDETIHNGDFETGDLSGWKILNESVWTRENNQYRGVISADTYWEQKLPYNQEGAFHLDGWAVTDNESAEWGVRSSTFVLSGSGWISLRMGGNAAQVKVYRENGSLIGTFNQNRFHDVNFPFLSEGGSWAEMGTYFINLSDHLGEKLYLELWDRAVDAWGVAFFDDVKCYYSKNPNIETGYDTVIAPVRGGNDTLEYAEFKIPWTQLGKLQTDVLKLSFEENGFEIQNEWGKKQIAKLESVFEHPVYQKEPVEPYRPDGICGKALNFDGYSNSVSCAGKVEGNKLTVDVYVCPRVFTWSAPQDARENHIPAVFAGDYDSAQKKGFLVGVTKHGYLTFRVGTGNQWYCLTGDKECCIPTYQWSRVTAVFDGDSGKMYLYLNGKIAANMDVAKGSEILNASERILVGRGCESVYATENRVFDKTSFPGLMDELTISLTAKTPEEVLDSGYPLKEISYEEAMTPDSALAGDYFRPTYHAVPSGNWMNEPHALFEYKGRWHLFYQ